MPVEFRGLVKRLKALQEANPGIGWFGQFGTAGVLAIQDKMGGQPTRNYTESTFDACKDIDGSTLVKTILKERDTCYACVVRCKRVVEVHDPDLDVDPVSAISPTPRSASPTRRSVSTRRWTLSGSASSCGGHRGSSTGPPRRSSWCPTR